MVCRLADCILHTDSLTGHNCVSCMDPIRGVEVRTPCAHYYDKTCILDLFEAAMKDESLFPSRCCRQHIPFASVSKYMTSTIPSACLSLYLLSRESARAGIRTQNWVGKIHRNPQVAKSALASSHNARTHPETTSAQPGRWVCEVNRVHARPRIILTTHLRSAQLSRCGQAGRWQPMVPDRVNRHPDLPRARE